MIFRFITNICFIWHLPIGTWYNGQNILRIFKMEKICFGGPILLLQRIMWNSMHGRPRQDEGNKEIFKSSRPIFMLCRRQLTCMNIYWPMCDVYVVVSRSFLLVSLPFEQLLIVLYCVNISLLEYLSRSFIHTSNMPNILYLHNRSDPETISLSLFTYTRMKWSMYASEY